MVSSTSAARRTLVPTEPELALDLLDSHKVKLRAQGNECRKSGLYQVSSVGHAVRMPYQVFEEHIAQTLPKGGEDRKL